METTRLSGHVFSRDLPLGVTYTMTVDIYSDIACPWCYIGHRRFSRALETYSNTDDIEVVFRPYQLDPTLPESPVSLRTRLREKFGAGADAMVRRVTEVAQQEGLDFRFDRAQAVNTLTAHRLLRLAEQEYDAATQRRLAEKLFAAVFTDGKNIADADLLTELAASAGLNRKRVGAYLASGEGQRETQQEIAHAQQLGVRAVPTFVFDGKYAVQGAQPVETFLSVFDEFLSPEEATSSRSE